MRGESSYSSLRGPDPTNHSFGCSPGGLDRTFVQAAPGWLKPGAPIELELVLEEGVGDGPRAVVHGLGPAVVRRGQPGHDRRTELAGAIGAVPDQGTGG